MTSIQENRRKVTTEPTFWAAPDFAKKGFRVFPTAPKEKHPSVEGGLYAGTLNLDKIAYWIQVENRGHHNIGITTGFPSDLVVIEVDDAEAYARMEERYGPPTVKSAHKHKVGGHWWFAHPGDGKVKCGFLGDLMPGAYCKGDGGYVLAPPSTRKVWTNGGIPDKSELPPLPDELRPPEKERKSDRTGRKVSDDRVDAAADVIARRVGELPQGSRHDHLLPLCGVLLARIDELSAETIIEEAWERTGDDDLAKRVSRGEVRRALDSTDAAIDEERATGVPSMEKITPGLYEELERILNWKLGVKVPDPEEKREEQRQRADEVKEEVLPLAKRPDLTADFANDLHASGVAGETRQIRILYLAVTSRVLEKPVSIAAKGPSSSGKSHLVEKVLEGFPESAYYALTAMSEKALIYLDEDMRHRFLVLYEAEGMAGDMQTYLMRTLLSENRIRYQTAESTGKGVKPRLLEMEGPTGLIVTTTQTRMHPENETRLFSLLVTDSRSQTKAIFRAIADQDRPAVSMDRWRDLQTWIEGQAHEVYIPYAMVLADMVPPLAVRLRRDFGAVLQLIRAHAVLHQARRERDDKGRIIATLDDYRIVRELVADLVAEGINATVSPTIRETVRAVASLLEDSGDESIGMKAIAETLNIDRSAAQRRVKAARDDSYLVNLEEKRGMPAKIAVGAPLPADIEVLPKVEKLRDKWGVCTCARGNEGVGGSSEISIQDVQTENCTALHSCTGKGPNEPETLQESRQDARDTREPAGITTPNASLGGTPPNESAQLHTPTQTGEDGLHTPAVHSPVHTPEDYNDQCLHSLSACEECKDYREVVGYVPESEEELWRWQVNGTPPGEEA